MKVIFLDIDGVLSIIPQGRDEYGAIFHPHLVDNLRAIIDVTGVDIGLGLTKECAQKAIEILNNRPDFQRGKAI